MFGVQWTRHLWITIVRYVDAVFVIAHFIESIYPRIVSFVSANDGLGTVGKFNVAKFLDLLVLCELEGKLFHIGV